MGLHFIEGWGYNSAKTRTAVPSSMSKKNGQKRKARPKRSIDNPGADHDLGLWVDYDLLRRHQGRPPEFIQHAPTSAANNRYLQLADIALGNNKPKKKSKNGTRRDSLN